ncbi:MAG: CocE/NonD family hydrolase [Phycisphaerae bacterium]|nr:CocE/NonD family hydrolase [Phycisphaerae bacterium]
MAAGSGLLSGLWRVLTKPLLTLGHPRIDPFQAEPEKITPRVRAMRIVRGLLRRLLLAPVMLVAVMAMLVFLTTHRMGLRPSPNPDATPASVNAFYRDVRIKTGDGVTLAGWYVPAWSASRFMQGGEQELRRQRAGLVLCHGAWADKSQLLHLVPALHDAGYELLLIDMRGCGESEGRISLGLEEWQDVQAAVKWLQKSGPADPQRIGVIATDTSVTAALREASQDPAVRVVVADRPSCTLGGFIHQRFDSIRLPGASLGRLYEWSFALSQGADLSEASSQRWAGSLKSDQWLLVTARAHDSNVPSGDPLLVLSSANCRKRLGANPFPLEAPGQPAVIPRQLVTFLRTPLPPIGPPANEPVARVSE